MHSSVILKAMSRLLQIKNETFIIIFFPNLSSERRKLNKADNQDIIQIAPELKTQLEPMRKGKIVVVGSSNTDMIVRTARIPGPGETVLGGRFLMAGGGKGANQAVAAARAGGDVTFIARIGNDMFGRRAVQGFRKDGIHVEFVKKDMSAASGVALIVVDVRGENCITVASGANARLSPADVRAAAKSIASADILLMQLEIPMETVTLAAAIAAKHGVPVILNPAPARSLPRALLKNITYLTPNEPEAALLARVSCGRRADLQKTAGLLAKKVGSVISTMGAKGSFIATAHSGEFVPAFCVKAVDTTAAGDVFNGCLAVALAEGNDPRKAVRFASAAAAISVTRWGAQPSAPYRPEIERFLRRRTSHMLQEEEK
jgi:ribokinase